MPLLGLVYEIFSVMLKSLSIEKIDTNIIRWWAIVFLVMASSGAPVWLQTLACVLGAPVLFLNEGFSLHETALDHVNDTLVEVFKKVYLPFVIWSVLFLLLHNPLVYIGWLHSEYWGFYDTFSRVWTVVFALEGYDEGLCSSYWIFRTLIIANLIFVLFVKFLRKIIVELQLDSIVIGIVLISWLLSMLQMGCGFSIPIISGGGTYELIAIGFIGCGFLLRKYFGTLKKWNYWLLGSILIIGLFVAFAPPFSQQPTVLQLLLLIVPSFAAFLIVMIGSDYMRVCPNLVRRGIHFLSKYSLCIVGFYLLVFKMVSMAVVLFCGLKWSVLGHGMTVNHTVVPAGLFLLYVLLGVILPPLSILIWRKADSRYNLTFVNCLKYSVKGLVMVLVWMFHAIIRLMRGIWQSIKSFVTGIKGVLKASNPNEE